MSEPAGIRCFLLPLKCSFRIFLFPSVSNATIPNAFKYTDGSTAGEDEIKALLWWLFTSALTRFCTLIVFFSARDELWVANMSQWATKKTHCAFRKWKKTDTNYTVMVCVLILFVLLQVWWKCIASRGVWSWASRQQLFALKSCSSCWRTSAACGTTS